MMATTICLYKSSQLGFDLDTRRPLFHDPAEAEAYMSGRALYTFRSSNFNKFGDPMLLPLDFDQAAQCDVGTFVFDGQGTLFWFRIRDIYVNESNRTQADYDIDYAMTFAGLLGRGHIERVPRGNQHARGMPVNPKFWEYKASTQFANGVRVAFVLKQMKSTASSQSYDIDGPVYCVIECRWFVLGQDLVMRGVNPLAELSQQTSRFALSDIVNAWIIPAVGKDAEGNMRYWDKVNAPSTNVSWWRYTVSTGMAHWDVSHRLTGVPAAMIETEVQGGILKGTESSEGRMMGICDERGSILYTFPDKVRPTFDFYMGFRMSMASCEVDIVLGDTGFITAHTTDRMFTYSCRPVDVMADSWQDYLFRQRAAEIEGRKIQNDTALAGGVGNAARGPPLGAPQGGRGPRPGARGRAHPRGRNAIVGTAVNYGVQSYYGDKQQALIDKTFQLAQDQVAVTGMITSYAIALQSVLFVFMIEADSTTMDELDAECAIMGVPADGFTLDMSQEMADAMNTTEFLPWACTAEVDDTIDMPASWKRIVSEQLRKGACYKKFGAWPS
jgi:hypothetical protein